MISLKNIARYEGFLIDDGATAKEALAAMHANRKGCVVLVREEKPVGILTEGHIVRLLDSDLPLETPAVSICVRKVISANENRPIDFAFEFLSKHGIRRIVLTDDTGRFRGVVLQEDLFAYLDKDVYKIDLKLSDIIHTDHEVITLERHDSVREALALMRNRGVGSVVISDEHGYPAGIVTEKDILELAYQEEDPEKPLYEHMSAPLFTREPETAVTEVIDTMKRRGFRRVVVVDREGFCLSVLTDRDILRQIRGNYTKMLQNKIRHAQEIMNMLPEAIMEIFDTHDHQVIHWMNRKAIEIFGEDLIDKEIHHLLPPSDWRTIYDSLEKGSPTVPGKLRIGDRVYEIATSASQEYRNRYIKIVFNDVTDHEKTKRTLQRRVEEEMLKRLEHEHLLMQQSKLATMGEMIGHIAHQWRQPLAQIGGIFMNLDAAAAFGELTPEYLHEKIRRGNTLLKHMSQTIEDFRRFFEPGQEKIPFEIHAHIQNAISIIEASLTYHHIRIDFSPPERPVLLFGYPSEFSQVMLNLIGNAKDVLVEREVKNPFIHIAVEETENGVLIRVRDNGGGIEASHIERIFDPYYTTKRHKDGTGLGLYISRLIVESRIGGKIYARNTETGAEFIIETQKTPL